MHAIDPFVCNHLRLFTMFETQRQHIEFFSRLKIQISILYVVVNIHHRENARQKFTIHTTLAQTNKHFDVWTIFRSVDFSHLKNFYLYYLYYRELPPPQFFLSNLPEFTTNRYTYARTFSVQKYAFLKIKNSAKCNIILIFL